MMHGQTNQVSDKSCRENQNTHLVFNTLFFPPEIRAVYEIIWNHFVEPGRPQMKIWSTRIACWIPKATNTLRICNTSFRRQQWLRERASIYVTRTLPVLSILTFSTITSVQFHSPFKKTTLVGAQHSATHYTHRILS